MLKVNSSDFISKAIENPLVLQSSNKLVIVLQQLSLDLHIYYDKISDMKIINGVSFVLELTSAPDILVTGSTPSNTSDLRCSFHSR